MGQELTASREAELARQAGATFDLAEVNAEIATGIVYAGADDVAARSRAGAWNSGTTSAPSTRVWDLSSCSARLPSS